jgi:NAD(P)H-hydrate epimerase
MQSIKVVTAHEMARIEGLAYAKGALEIDFMERAGESIAETTAHFIQVNDLEKEVTLLVGKGNNGGDAYVAGRKLLEKGFVVRAIHFFSLDSCGPLCQEQFRRFKQIGGEVHFIHVEEMLSLEFQGVLLDGLVGTGFRGAAEGMLAHAIRWANDLGLPILAIDIPSGVNGNTGEVATIAIRATQTIYLELPKIGFFIGQGWNHVGELVHAAFGLDDAFIEEANVEAELVDVDSLSSLMPEMKRNRHKYQAGYVLGFAGSSEMSGAAILSSSAALRAGAGIIRLFHPHDMEFLAAPVEIIKELINWPMRKRFFQEEAHASAAFFGPGIGRTKEVKKLLKNLLVSTDLPSVIDADALYFLAHQSRAKLPEKTVLTPHRKEMERLLSLRSIPRDEKAFHTSVQEFANKRHVTVVLKGAPTFIFHPNTTPLIIARGDPGMATAGTGDVLTGIIAALLAQKLDPHQAAILGVALHALAGEYAAIHKTSYCMIASDLIHHLPDAFSHLMP